MTATTLKGLYLRREAIYKSFIGKYIYNKKAWPPMVYCTLIIVFHHYIYFGSLLSLNNLKYTLLGLFTFSLLEYFIHRFIFHLFSIKGFLKTHVELIHLPHHFNEKSGVNMGIISVLVSYLFLSLFGSVLTFPYWLSGGEFGKTLSFVNGTLIGLMAYEFFHYLIHFSNLNWNYLNYLKRFHSYHHHKNIHYNFGISSPLWDFIFQTYRNPYS